MIDDITFTSGRELYANNRIVGIDDDGYLFQGYDGGIPYPDTNGYDVQFSPEDMRELADLMIMRWQRFKDSIEERSKLDYWEGYYSIDLQETDP